MAAHVSGAFKPLLARGERLTPESESEVFTVRASHTITDARCVPLAVQELIVQHGYVLLWSHEDDYHYVSSQRKRRHYGGVYRPQLTSGIVTCCHDVCCIGPNSMVDHRRVEPLSLNKGMIGGQATGRAKSAHTLQLLRVYARTYVKMTVTSPQPGFQSLQDPTAAAEALPSKPSERMDFKETMLSVEV